MDGNYIPSKLPPRISLELKEFKLLRETPCGFWICTTGFFFTKKWVSKTSRRRYAFPTKEEALKNFQKRTEKRIRILTNQLDACKQGLYLAKQVKI
jgi:hypothetical protein